MSTFFAGNTKTILLKKQVDADTPVTDFTDAIALRITNFQRPAPRTISQSNETDRSTQAAAVRVTGIGPTITFDLYGLPSEVDALAEALLGDNDDSATVDPTTHEALPTQDMPWYSILEVNDYGNTRWEGCRLGAATFTGQDEGETELQITGLAWMARSFTDGVASPDPFPTPAVEASFIYAESTVKYDGSSEGRTSQVTVNVNRNLSRQQGDNGFTAIGITPGKLQVDGQATRYTADDDTMREVDTGATDGTSPTSTVATHSFSWLFTRGTGPDQRQLLLSVAEIAFTDRQEAIDPADGKPVAEVLSWQGQPQATLAEQISIITVNDKTTPSGD